MKGKKLIETPIDAASGGSQAPNLVNFLYNPTTPGVPNNSVKPDPYVNPFTVNKDTAFDDKLVQALIAKINSKHPEEKLTGASAGVKALMGKKVGDIMKDGKIEFKSLQGKLVLTSETGATQQEKIRVGKRTFVPNPDAMRMYEEFQPTQSGPATRPYKRVKRV